MNEGNTQDRWTDLLNRDGFLAHFCEVGDLLTGEVGMLNNFRLLTYLCLKLDLEPAPLVLRQVVLTNSLDSAGWDIEAK